jgi:AcrR family transcriptional regulator
MCFTSPMSSTPTPAQGVRARVKDEMRRQILDAARARLATDGAAGLSLRAVARDVGLVSSAVYRYVPSRDALLTELIIEAYDGLADAAEALEAAVPRADLAARWQAVCSGVWRWGVAQPNEWALIFGSPVPGYAAPFDTVRAAARTPTLLLMVLYDAAESGLSLPSGPLSDEVARSLAPIRAQVPDVVPDEALLRGLTAWAWLLGAVSSHLFGQRHNVITDEGAEVFFVAEALRIGGFIGLPEQE